MARIRYCIVSVVGKVRTPFLKRCTGVLVPLQKDLLLNRAFETFLCACGTGLATYSHYSRQAQLWIRILYFPMAVPDPDPTGKLGKVN
jgi:hypothetical protein